MAEPTLNNAHTTLEALDKALPEKDDEGELIRPVFDIWPEVVREHRERRSERA